MEEILKIENLEFQYFRGEKIVPALRGVNLSLKKGECLGIVGESGSGKTTLLLSILRLIPQEEGKIYGKIIYRGKDICSLDKNELRKIRGGKIGIIFQDPFNSLNPVFTIKKQIQEALLIHQPQIKLKEIDSKIKYLLSQVHLPNPEQVMAAYPHQLSGGMLQRVMIALALAGNPEILLTDEPTTALDVTVQKEILDLLKELQNTGLSIILVTHDLGVASQICNRLAIMYAGKIVEEGLLKEILFHPAHYYTKGLIKCLPYFSLLYNQKYLFSIPGEVPDPQNLGEGCPFSPRCAQVKQICKEEEPVLTLIKEKNSEHKVACFFYEIS